MILAFAGEKSINEEGLVKLFIPWFSNIYIIFIKFKFKISIKILKI